MAYMTRSEIKDGLRIIFICVCWYVVSSSNGVLGKTILSQFPFPMTMTMVQLSSIALMSPPLLRLLSVRSYEASGWGYHWRMLFPLAFAKFLSSVLAHVSIWKVPVSYAHTVKATMPIFTVLITRLALGTRHATLTYLSLLPIVGGVAVATMSEVAFDMLGLTTALAATAGFAIITIFSKQALRDTGMHHLRLLHKLGQMAAIMFFPVWLLVDAPRVIPELTGDTALLLVVDGALHWVQNILAFTLLKLVTPLTYAVANVTKRIAVISVSLLLLKNPVTWVNMGGMVMAILGE
jgi:solute carrier family 35 protein E1